MKIRFTKKQISNAPRRIVRLIFSEKNKTGLKEYEDGRVELNIEIPANKDLDLQRYVYMLRRALRMAKESHVTDIGISYDDIKHSVSVMDINDQHAGFLFAVNALMADFSFDHRKSDKNSREKRISFLTIFGDISKDFRAGIEKGVIAGEEINKARFLCNTPGTELSPSFLVKEVKKAAKDTGVKVTILDKKKISSLKMEGILGVGRGSDDGPYLIVMKYNGTKSDEQPIALAGKGITFDTGGINLKPGGASLGMHMDMSGGGAVIHTVIAAARLKMKLNIVAVIPAVENVVSGSSYKPGDILTMMSGKTVEVINTDAEGRLVLADALNYLKRFKPKTVIDTATLTGASVVSLGDKYSALFSDNEDLKNALLRSGERTGERVWHMPMSYEYGKDMKGEFTDLVNASRKSPNGGACSAAAFLKEFTEYTDSWAHIDIAPRMEAGEHDNLAKGSLGAPIILLLDYLNNIKKGT